MAKVVLWMLLFLNSSFLFSTSLMKKDTLILSLDSGSNYQKEISQGLHSDLISLTILVKGNLHGWMVGPPLSSGPHNLVSSHDYNVFLGKLPVEITGLFRLKYLDVAGTGINQLPDFKNLSELEKLDISFNPVSIKDEVKNLSQLTSLQYLNIMGCDFDEEVLSLLRKKMPDLVILHTFHSAREAYFPIRPYYPNPNELLLLNLLNKIQQYYPIGMPHFNDIHDGYAELKKITEKKINTHLEADAFTKTENMVPWESLVTESKHLLGENIIDQSYLQFPSLNLIIIMDSADNKNRESKNMTLTLSLLTNHYTIFIESQFTLANYIELNHPLRYQVVYGEKNASDDELAFFKNLKELLSVHFPDYKFVNHYLLMTNKIKGGIPYGESVETNREEYPIYSFLFGPLQHFSNIRVIE